MKISILCNTDNLVFPTLLLLKSHGLLASVGIPAQSYAKLYPQLLQASIDTENIILLRKADWQEQMLQWLEQTEPDAVWVFAFPWRIPDTILNKTPQGFLNFHFGLLPKYRGADPVFWQLKNRETRCGLVVHRMTADIDRGPVVWTEERDVIPGENYAMHCLRMGHAAASIIVQLLARLADPSFVSEAQTEEPALYCRKPAVSDFTIHWQSHTAEEIEWLVNASNPRYDGAVTSLRGMEVRMLEVTPVHLPAPIEAGAGTIVHADPVYGLIVACADKKFLRINVLHLPEGYLSGIKLFSMGVQAGEVLV